MYEHRILLIGEHQKCHSPPSDENPTNQKVTTLRQEDRFGYLDTLRALAALSVVCSHYFLYNPPPSWIEKCCEATPLAFW